MTLRINNRSEFKKKKPFGVEALSYFEISTCNHIVFDYLTDGFTITHINANHTLFKKKKKRKETPFGVKALWYFEISTCNHIVFDYPTAGFTIYKYIRPWKVLVKTIGPRWQQLCYFAEGHSPKQNTTIAVTEGPLVLTQRLEWRPYIFVLYTPFIYSLFIDWLKDF